MKTISRTRRRHGLLPSLSASLLASHWPGRWNGRWNGLMRGMLIVTLIGSMPGTLPKASAEQLATLSPDAFSVLGDARALFAAKVNDRQISAARDALFDRLQALPETNRRVGTLSQTEIKELADLLGRLGGLYFVNGQKADAALAWEAAHRVDPNGFVWVYWLAHLARSEARYRDEFNWLTEAQALKPDYPTLLLREAQAMQDMGMLAEAAYSYQTVIDDARVAAAALHGLGEIALLTRDYPGAVRYLEAALAIDPQASALHYPLAQAYRALGHRDKAVAALKRKGERKPAYEDPLIERLQSLQNPLERAFVIGLGAIQRGDYQAASLAFAEGVGAQPDNIPARISYARALYLAGETDAALRQFEEAEKRAPDNAAAAFFALIARQPTLTEAELLAGYQGVLERDPDHLGARLMQANLLLRQEKYQQASRAFDIAPETIPKMLPVHIHRLLADVGADRSIAELRARLDEAEAVFPQHPALIALRESLQNDAGLSRDHDVFKAFGPEQVMNPQRIMANYPMARPY